MSSIFASLRLYNYRIWFIGALVANVGTWMQRVAQDWLVLAVLPEGSAIHVGIVTGLQFLPIVFISPFAGLIADRVDRRKMLMMTQAAMGVLALALGALVLLGTAQVWHVYFFALALGVLSAFDAPARQVFVSDIVPTSSLANAVALNSASFNAARLVGPGVAGLLIAVVGTGWVFMLNALTFAATIGAMLAMKSELLQRRDRPVRAKGQLREGLRYVRGRSDIITIMIVVFVIGGLGLKFQMTSAVMAHDEFGMGAGEYGVLGSILAIGSLAGALMAARRQRPRLRLVLGAAFGFGISSGAMALMPTYELFALSAIPVGYFSLTMLTSANAAIQITTDPNVRGRVMSLYLVVFFAGNPIGGPVVGWIAENWGARWAIGIGAIAAILVAGIAALWTVKREDVRVRYRLRQRPHLLVQNRHEQLDAARAREELRTQEGVNAGSAA
ncbi:MULTISPECIES: MFS transporter [unclassified Pseudactinotalea]|uniref:MFS transporter n=1 Tax=Micrococcales TaxID=85006 RepID=UPI003C7CABFF